MAKMATRVQGLLHNGVTGPMLNYVEAEAGQSIPVVAGRNAVAGLP